MSFGLCPLCKLHRYLVAYDFKDTGKKIWICDNCMMTLE